MMNKKKLTKVIITTLIATSIAAGGSFTLYKNVKAATPSATTTQQERGHGKRDGFSSEAMKTQLDTLVKAGTITQAEEDKIIAYIKQQDDTRKAEIDKVNAMSDADKKAYMEKNKPTEKNDIFMNLVDQKIITQVQADAIKAAIPKSDTTQDGMQGMGGKHGQSAEEMKTQLDTLVKAGTITQAEEDKITAYIKEKDDAKKVEMDKVNAMSEADRKAYMGKNKPTEKNDIFKNLVDQKIITQVQADAIKSTMQKPTNGTLNK